MGKMNATYCYYNDYLHFYVAFNTRLDAKVESDERKIRGESGAIHRLRGCPFGFFSAPMEVRCICDMMGTGRIGLNRRSG